MIAGLDRPLLEAARTLLGMRLRSEVDGRPTEVQLTEVEAYAGDDDPASHAYRGKTARNGAMFGQPGTAYVYKSYGIHWMLNVSVTAEGTGDAVLLRGGIPLLGGDVMSRRRGRRDALANGPGKLAQALGVTGDHDGITLTGGQLELLPGEPMPGTIIATPRIGISKATERLWRFVVVQSVGAGVGHPR